MSEIKKHTDDLGSLSIGKLLAKLSIPATIGMMVMVIYNVIDTIFVAKYVGTMAIGGLAIVMPITMLITAVGMSLGVGGASLISRYLGANEKDKANSVFGNLLILTLSITLFFTVVGYIFPDFVLNLFGAKGEITPYAKEYYLIVLAGAPFLGLSMAGNNIIRSEGNARMSMTVMLVSSVLNLVLDYFFIIQFNWGISGAAWATLISQVITFIFIVYYFIVSGKSSVVLNIKHLKINFARMKEVVAIGSSSFARQGSSSIVAIFINHSLMNYGNETDVAIYGILNKVMLMSIFPMIGLVQGFLPIMGYNYGAKNIERIKKTIKISFSTAFILGSISLFIMTIFPTQVFQLFTDDTALIQAGARYLVIVMVVIPLVGIQMMGASFFQAIGKAKPALMLTLSRQLFFIIPLIFILPKIYGLEGIWYVFPVSDICATLLTVIYLTPYYRKITSHTE